MNKIVDKTLQSFCFLGTEYGFSKPFIIEDGWITTLSYLGKEVGVEIELDFRNLDVFILIVKLKNGELPRGYYVADGKKVRVHFEKIIKENKTVKNNRIMNQEEFENLIFSRSASLNKHMDKIISLGREIFD